MKPHVLAAGMNLCSKIAQNCPAVTDSRTLNACSVFLMAPAAACSIWTVS
jgi:hypothetical protein